MKSGLIARQPYYVFLIIARLMGWNIPQEKKVEVRKDYPKDPDWDKVTHIYCSRNRKSFNRIPARYQPFMVKRLGKVIGKFACDSIRKGRAGNSAQAYCQNSPDDTCLTDQELVLYANAGKPLYFWHISDLKIYDKPKELGEFKNPCDCGHDKEYASYYNLCQTCENIITRPPQSWRYVQGGCYA